MSGFVFGVIPCSATKLDRRAPAAELYTGPLFRSALYAVRAMYGRGQLDGYLILSAAHGLVDPHQELEPYDVTIGGELEAPTELIAHQLNARGVHQLLPLLPKRYDAKLREAAMVANLQRDLTGALTGDWQELAIRVLANPLTGSAGLLEQRKRLRQLRERVERVS